jgi:Mg-chelatase subunit ChlD
LNFSKIEKWRLILGKPSDPEEGVPMDSMMKDMDNALDSLYDNDRKGGLSSSAPQINRWLGDIRNYFPNTVVQVMMKDAMERLNLKRLLLEPEILENLQPDVELAATLIQLNKTMPDKSRETARMVVRKVVEELEKKLANSLIQAINGALNRSAKNRRPKHNEINWNKTILKNLKHYQADYKTIIPENLVGFGRKGKTMKDVILCVDQSGSMASSVVYSGIFGAIMASMRSIRTKIVFFDTAVVDMSEELDDPVELLFGTQLGGGTDINKAVAYCETLIVRPTDTILLLITDLYEGGNAKEMLQRIAEIKSSGVNVICLLALDNNGTPSFDKTIASQLASLDIHAFACTPDKFPDLMAKAIGR